MTDITIYTSANNGEEILVLPIVPANLPDILQEYGHTEFETNNKVLTLIGKRKRKSFDLEILLPCNKNYSKANSKASSNGRDYIDFWEKWSNKEVPMRLVITDGDIELLNMAYTLNNFSWKYDKKKDIIAKLSVIEYMFTTDISNNKKTEYKWSDITLKVNGSGCKVKAANVDGHWIVPIRKLLELAGYAVIWNGQEKAIYMTKKGISYKLKSDIKIYDGISYSYLYKVCDELGFTAKWEAKSKTANVTEIYKWAMIDMAYGKNVQEIKACMVENRWLLPARKLLEMLGYNVVWNSSDKTINAIKNGISYKITSELQIYDNIAYYYGYKVCDELGYSLAWDRESNRITIKEAK